MRAARPRKSSRMPKPIVSRRSRRPPVRRRASARCYEEYKKAPDVTRQRIYLETMERVFGGTDKIILDSAQQGGQAGAGVVPVLPLNEMTRRPATGGTQ